MSYKKGEFYRCISNVNGWGMTLALTVGKCYECFGDNKDLYTKNDHGVRDFYEAFLFDHRPVPQIQPSVVAAHAASQIGATPSPKAALPKQGTPKCKCGEYAEKKTFPTFEYFFCAKCKVEVGGKAEESKSEPQWNSGAQLSVNHIQSMMAHANSLVAQSIHQTGTVAPVRFGYVANKGEKITCVSCGAEHGFLTDDLPPPGFTRRVQPDPVVWTAFNSTDCCAAEDESRYDPFEGCSLFHVKGRGFV